MFLRKLSDWLIKVSVALVVYLLYFAFLIFSMTVVKGEFKILKGYSGDAGSIDMSILYNADDVFNMAEEYGEIGRETYIHQALSVDVLFPVLSGAFLLTTISFLVGELFEPGNKWRLINLLPIPSVFFDYLENSLAIMIMRAYPQKLTILASIVPYLTLLKFLFMIASISTILILLGIMTWRYFKTD